MNEGWYPFCRATLVDQGPNHPAESWDFQAGDIWYFPSNVGHAVLGLEHGCSYLAVYDEGDFDENINGRGLGFWLSLAPPSIAGKTPFHPKIEDCSETPSRSRS